MRVLFAGLGAVGQRHLRNLHALLGDALEVAAWRVRGLKAVVDDRLELDTGASVEELYRVRVFDSLAGALSEFRPELVMVSNPTRFHVPVALEAARANAHLFIEKPLGSDLEGTDELRRTVEQRGLAALVGFQMRFHPCFLRLSEILAAGEIGSPLAVRARYGEYLPGFHPYEDYRTGYAARAALGGGVVLTQIHDLDYLTALFGMPRRVFALGGHLSGLEIDVEDVASMLLDCRAEDRSLPVHLQQDFLSRPAVRACEIVGERGSVAVDFRNVTLTRTAAGGEVVETFAVPGFERNTMFLDLMRHLLACVAGEARPLTGLVEAIRVQTVADCARASLANGLAVDIEAVATA